MKRKLMPFMLILVLLFSLAFPVMAAEDARSSPSILIAYFSWSGHTKQIAEEIHAQAGGDMFEIQPETPYTDNINELSGIALREQRENARPALAAHVEDMSKYDVVFVGYPCWWSNMPMPVFTFLEEYNFAGKTVIPFTSYGENVFGRSLESMKEILNDATIADGFAIQEHAMQDLPEKVSAWLQNLGIGNNTGSDENPNGGNKTDAGNDSNQGTDAGIVNEPDAKGAVDISGNTRVTLSKTSYVYDGKAKKPTVTIKNDSVKLTINVDYTVSYMDNIKVGTASVTITGIGDYSGVVTETFTILPKGTSISGKITAKSKAFTLKWKKTVQSLSGYQVQYSTDRKFTKRRLRQRQLKIHRPRSLPSAN